MTRIVWTDPAVEEFELIYRIELRRRVYKAISGLARFPRRGRVPPEAARFPDLVLSTELREVVFPRLLRVFYRYEESSDTVIILAIFFRGQEVGGDWLGRLLDRSE